MAALEVGWTQRPTWAATRSSMCPSAAACLLSTTRARPGGCLLSSAAGPARGRFLLLDVEGLGEGGGTACGTRGGA
eukprot:scaffold46143_cov26-Tisochrysis_lutea.AAC.4